MQKPTYSIIRVMAVICAVIIGLMPFHAFLTVWGSSLIGHYTLLRLWKEVLLALLLIGSFVVLVGQPPLRRRFIRDRLFVLICLYGLVLVVAGGVALALHGVSKKALAYGLLLDGRYLVFFCITWLITLHDDVLVRWWERLLLIPAAVAVLFATLQYSVLPADFLKHFGYGPHTILPTETVDQKAAYRRVQSTLRGANPLGAYLVLVLSAAGAWVLKGGRRWMAVILFVLSLGALFFTLSRSAWLGALVALALLLWFGLSSQRARQGLLATAGTLVVVFAGATLVLRHNDRFQNIFFHTSNTSHSAESSNAGHAFALKNGLRDVAHYPWGSGTGTAGPASVYNNHPPRIAENYYVQIAQEAGVEGLALFMSINVLVGWRLWRRRDTQLGLVMFVSLLGLGVVNMLLHAWADDTLAYVWWGLAGVAVAMPLKKESDSALAE